MNGNAATLVNASNLTLTATNTINVPTITQNSGTLTIDHHQTIPTLTLAGGAIDGSGDLTVTATFTWTAGMLTGAGTFTLATGATGTFTTTSSKEEARDFINNSVIAWDAGVLDLRTDNPTNETTFTNNGFLAVDLSQSSLTMQWGVGPHRPTFVSDTANKSSLIIGASAPTTHTLTISNLDTTIGVEYALQDGTLTYAGSGTNTIETLDLSAGTTLSNSASSLTITGAVNGNAATLVNATPSP